MSINWAVNPLEKAIIRRIVERAVELGFDRQPLDIEMDLVACHLNGCPLNLVGLHRSDDFTLFHDLSGISRHLSHQTGRLEGGFRPKNAKRHDLTTDGEESR